MKRILAIAMAAFLAASVAAYEAVDLAAGVPVRVPVAGKIAAVQILAGTNSVSGASVSLVRGTSTNSVASNVSASARKLVSVSPTNAVFAIPGDGLLLSAGANAVRATAIIED